MFNWIEIVLLALKIINMIMSRINQDQWIKSGRDAAIAEAAATILKKTAAGKAMMEKVNAMSPAEVDSGLRNLEPK